MQTELKEFIKETLALTNDNNENLSILTQKRTELQSTINHLDEMINETNSKIWSRLKECLKHIDGIQEYYDGLEEFGVKKYYNNIPFMILLEKNGNNIYYGISTKFLEDRQRKSELKIHTCRHYFGRVSN